MWNPPKGDKDSRASSLAERLKGEWRNKTGKGRQPTKDVFSGGDWRSILWFCYPGWQYGAGTSEESCQCVKKELRNLYTKFLWGLPWEVVGILVLWPVMQLGRASFPRQPSGQGNLQAKWGPGQEHTAGECRVGECLPFPILVFDKGIKSKRENEKERKFTKKKKKKIKGEGGRRKSDFIIYFTSTMCKAPHPLLIASLWHRHFIILILQMNRLNLKRSSEILPSHTTDRLRSRGIQIQAFLFCSKFLVVSCSLKIKSLHELMIQFDGNEDPWPQSQKNRAPVLDMPVSAPLASCSSHLLSLGFIFLASKLRS